MRRWELCCSYLLLTGFTLALPWWVSVSPERADTLWLFGVGINGHYYEILSVRIPTPPRDVSPLIESVYERMFLPHAQLLPFLYIGFFVFLCSCVLMNIGVYKKSHYFAVCGVSGLIAVILIFYSALSRLELIQTGHVYLGFLFCFALCIMGSIGAYLTSKGRIDSKTGDSKSPKG
jgi:hypothetical protein